MKAAKESKEPQQFQIGDYGKKVVVWPSGKMQVHPDDVDIDKCKECGKEIQNEAKA